jgi:predicted nucleic acid-binding Zn ribbon protein
MMPIKKNSQPVVAAILPSLVRQNGWEIQLDLHSVFGNWGTIVDPETAEHCRPLKIRRGVLWLEVENSAWLQQLRFQKYQLLEAINATMTKSRIEDIKYVLPEGKNPAAEQPEVPVRFVPPPPAEVTAFRGRISFIDDEQCREALFRFWYLVRACCRK